MRTLFYATDRTEHSVPHLKYAYDLCTKLNASLLVDLCS